MHRKPKRSSLFIKFVVMGCLFWGASHSAVNAFTNNYLFLDDPNSIEKRCIPDHSFYLLKKDVNELERGKIYTFTSDGLDPYFDDGEMITKYVAGIAGDVVTQNAQGVFINGDLLAKSYSLVDVLGIEEKGLYSEYRLKENEVFFYAPAENSFDSRYWGAADASLIVGEAIPLW